MRLLWLPAVLRGAGLTTYLVSGWEGRGGDDFDPRGIICHATAGSATSTDAGEISVLLHGSTSAPPPIAQLYLGRNGHWHVVASGRCNHALTGWGGPLEGHGNRRLIGVEAANDNRGQPWPAVQVDAYQRGVAAICARMGWTAADNVAAHREHQPGAKTDPHGIDMAAFRTRVTALLAGGDDDVSAEDVLNYTYDDGSTLKNNVHFAYMWSRQLLAELPALRAAVAADKDITPEELTAAVQAGVAQAGDALTAALVPQLVAGLIPHMAGATEADVERIVTDVIGGVRLVPPGQG